MIPLSKSCALFLGILVLWISWLVTRRREIADEEDLVCHSDYEYGMMRRCRPACQHGHFSLVGMTECVPWLTCRDFSEIRVQERIGGGAVKQVFLANWKDHLVVLIQLAEPLYREDFEHGLRMLTAFQPNRNVTQLLGYCNDEYITEYHRHRSADRLIDMLEREEFAKYDTPSVRFGLCLNYVELLVFVHNSTHGIRVMCDSNDLYKTLSQLLVTVDLRLILNDLDALPEVIPPNFKIKCGHREIHGDFVAPEQRWPFTDRPFDDDDMPSYDEKSDVWKIPDVCLHFLGNKLNVQTLIFHLSEIHWKCKIVNSTHRASAVDVILEYKEIYRTLGLQ